MVPSTAWRAVLVSAAKHWKCEISSASETAFSGVLGNFSSCWTLSKKRCISIHGLTCSLSLCVLICFIKLILRNRSSYSPGVSSRGSQGLRTYNSESPMYLHTLSSLIQSWVAGSSPCTLTTSLAIPIPSSSSSSGLSSHQMWWHTWHLETPLHQYWKKSEKDYRSHPNL